MEYTNSSIYRAFIIAEPDPIVSLDLVGILKTDFPDCDLTVIRDGTEAEQLILKAEAPVSVIINQTLISQAVTSALHGCVGRGGRVVVLGSAYDAGFDARFVITPFTSGMVVSALSFLEPDAPA